MAKETITLKELKKLLKQYPDDTEVLLMKDWDNCPINEDGCFVPDDEHLVSVDDTNFCHQVAYYDCGIDGWNETNQLIIG